MIDTILVAVAERRSVSGIPGPSWVEFCCVVVQDRVGRCRCPRPSWTEFCWCYVLGVFFVFVPRPSWAEFCCYRSCSRYAG